MRLVLKYLTTSAFLIALISCQANKSEVIEMKPTVVAQIPETTAYLNTTAYEFPTVKIPDGYYFDTLNFYDSTKRAFYSSTMIKTPDSAVNQKVSSELQKRMHFENEDVSDYVGERSQEVIFTYNLQPVYFYQDSKVMSIAYIIDTYTDGGNHHNYAWYATNIDIDTKKTLGLGDFVQLKSMKDTAEFNALAADLSKKSNCPFDNLNFKRLHFSVGKDTLNLHPGYEWSCGNVVIKIPKSHLK